MSDTDAHQTRRALKQIAEGASVTLLVTIIGYLFIFVLKLLVIRYFGPHDYGVYEMLTTLFGILGLLAAMGISPGIAQHIASYRSRGDGALLKGYLRFIFTVPLVMAVVLAIAATALAPWIAGKFAFGPDFVHLIRVIAWFLPLRVINETVAYALQAEKKMLLGNLGYNVIERAVMIVGMIIIIFWHLPLYALIILFGISLLVALLFHAFAAGHILSALRTQEPTTMRLREWFMFALPLLFTGVFYFILSWTDNIVIGAKLTPSDLGVYAATYAFASYLLYIPPMFFNIVTPVVAAFAERDAHRIPILMARVRNWSFVAASFFAAIFILFPSTTLRILYGPAFAAGGTSFLILSICFLVCVYFASYNTLLLLARRTQYIFVSTVTFAAVNLALALTLINHYPSIVVVALSTGATAVLLKVTECIGSRQSYRVPWTPLFVLKALLASFGSALLTLGIMRAIAQGTPTIGVLVLGLCAYVVLFFGLVFLLRVFSEEDAVLLDIVEERLRVRFVWIRRVFFRT